MKIYLKEEFWQKVFPGWIITGCAIRDRNIVYFCLREELPYEKMKDMWDSEIPSRLAALYLNTPESPYGWKELEGFSYPIAGVSRQPMAQGLLVSCGITNSTVCVMGKGGWPMESIVKGQGAGTENIRCINGYSYSVGVGREVYKRVDIGQWVLLAKGLPVEEDLPLDVAISHGFYDIDGFSEQDIYAVGGNGDVWRYDGSEWYQCAFPSNEQTNTVLCAPDGQVYIGGEGGSLWVGREHHWQQVYQGNSTILWNQLRWFNDKLWLCSDYQLRVWDGLAMQYVMDGERKVALSGHMDAYDGILIIAGSYRVDKFDGQQWQAIVRPYATN